jgi:hypothetical protein
MERLKLKELLLTMTDDNNVVPQEVKPYELAMEMMEYIGDPDPELRDDLILSKLSEWIIDKTLSTKEMNNLLSVALNDKHLLNGLGEYSDTVFSRTFSVLVIATIIYRHRNESFLSQDDLQEAFRKVLTFYNEDKDVRGYIIDKGWAHGAAHGADALDEFARCEEISSDGLFLILDSIYNKINIGHYGYIHFEEERMITAVKAVLERKVISAEKIEAWIRSFETIEKTDIYQEDSVRMFNVDTFLKSLYFRLIDISEYGHFASIVKDVIKKINKFNQI